MFTCSLVSKCAVVASCIVITVAAAAGEELPAFTPFSPASASKPGPFIHADGETLYRAICQGCHMPDARGAAGYPALAANPRLASTAFPAVRLLNGLGGMPRFAEMLSDTQIAAVVNYVRTNFGNSYSDHLSVDDVARMRKAIQ
jgi:mono/diheme cytochrome c family protein